MKVTIWLFGVFIIALILFGCVPTKDISREEAIALTVAAIDMDATREALEQSRLETSPTPTPDEQPLPPLMVNTNIHVAEAIVYDSEGVTIQVHSIDYGSGLGPRLILLIKNDMATTINLIASDVVVNGFMIDATLTANILAGETRVEALLLPISELDVSQIEDIQYIEFCFQIADSEAWSRSITTERVRVETDANQDFAQTLLNTGRFLIECEGVRIALNKLENEKMIVYIENNTDTDITIKVFGVSVNTAQVEVDFKEDVIAGAKIYKELVLRPVSSETLDLSKIDEIELQFQAFVKSDNQLIFETESMKLIFD